MNHMHALLLNMKKSVSTRTRQLQNLLTECFIQNSQAGTFNNLRHTVYLKPSMGTSSLLGSSVNKDKE